MHTDAEQRGLAMTSHTSSRYGLTYALAIAVTVAIAVVGSVWAMGNGRQATTALEGARIDVSALLTSAEIAKLPVLHIEEPF